MYFSKTTITSNIGADISTLIYVGFSVFSMLTYVIIFRTILQSRQSTRTNAVDEPKRSLFSFICKKIKGEGYTIPFVITLTYTLFVILPGGVRIVCFITKHDTSFNIAHTVWTVTYRLNTFSDTCINLFCDRDIQKYLKNKFRRNRVVCNSTQNNGTKNDDKGGNVKKITTDI